MMLIFGWLDVWYPLYTETVDTKRPTSQILASFLFTTKFPLKEILTLFFSYKEAVRKAVLDASHCATEDVMKVWAKELQLKEKKWKNGLENLFDIAHANNTLGMTTIQEYKNFLPLEKKASLV